MQVGFLSFAVLSFVQQAAVAFLPILLPCQRHTTLSSSNAAADDETNKTFFELIVGDMDEAAGVEEVGGDTWFLGVEEDD
jgi:hypothetical protein